MPWTAIVLGVVLPGVSVYLCIEVFLKVLDRIGILPLLFIGCAGAILFALFW